MIRFTSLFVLLLGTCALAAQCETNCPDDQLVVFLPGQTDSTISATAPVANCNTNLFHTLRGPVFGTGKGLPDNINLEVGTTEVTYTHTSSRFGMFTNTLTFLPDGDGTQYEVPFNVGGFDEVTTVGEAGGLTKICMMIEHSYLGDLDIIVECPTGERVTLQSFGSTGAQLLGEGDRETVTPDPLYLYCWTFDAPRSMSAYVSEFNIGADAAMPAIDYAPDESLANLDSCIISGEWKIIVVDNLSADQGYMSSAFLDFGEDNFSECSYAIEARMSTSTANLSRDLTALTAFPNPATEFTRLAVDSRSSSSGSLTVYAMNGAAVHEEKVSLIAGQNQLRVHTNNWPAGIYTARVHTAAGERSVRIVKR